jgi:hypothetical protein
MRYETRYLLCFVKQTATHTAWGHAFATFTVMSQSALENTAKDLLKYDGPDAKLTWTSIHALEWGSDER